MTDCIIIGGGAAGTMAALTAAARGRSVALFERNSRIGRKLLITGKGRCNVTNACSRQEFFDNIPVNPRFLYSAYAAFGCNDVISFFEERGVPLKTERGKRVFPVSDKAADIVSALEKSVNAQKNITVINERVREIITENNTAVGVRTDNDIYNGNSVLIAAGGLSYPKTGSDGDSYRFAHALGHMLIPTRPALVPLVCDEKWCADAMGLSLKNVSLSLVDAKNSSSIFTDTGEMLFTHFGVSGPLVLSASGHIQTMEHGRYRIVIDLKPALDEKKLDARILRDFGEFANRNFANSLDKLLPAKLIPIIVRLSDIPESKKVNSITREERGRLVKLLKGLTLTIRDFRPVSEAIITAGGVCVKEINPKTMESRLVKNLYFAGEAIDCSGYTGGFNLQIAFSTGHAAGIAM